MARPFEKYLSQRSVLDSRERTAWEKRMSNHIAYALLVYTGLQIFMVTGAMKSESMSLLPYFGLCFLVALIIPACRRFEKKWEALAQSGLPEGELHTRYLRDRVAIWALAIGLPFLFVLLFKGLALVF